MKIFKNREVFDKKIPLKNYVLVLVVSIIVILLTLFLRNLYLNYINNMNTNSYMSEMKLNEITKNDFDFVLSESSNMAIYVSKTGSKEIYNLGKKTYKLFDKNDLLDNLIYWNVSSLIDNNEYISILKNVFPNISGNLNELPFIVIIKDGVYKEAINVNSQSLENDNIIKIIKETFELTN